MTDINIAPYLRYSIFRKCPAEEWKIDLRTIPDHEFVLICGGEGIVRIEDKQHCARPGLLFYFFPGLWHSLQSNPDDPLVFYALHFSFTHLSYKNNQWSLVDRSSPLQLDPVHSCGNSKHLESIMKDINRYWKESPIGSNLMCRGLFLQLLHYLLDDYESGKQQSMLRPGVQKALTYIHEFYNKPIQIWEIAEQANLSADYFSFVFREATGFTPGTYISRCRINAAKEELAVTGSKIREVAHRVGYRDEFYFSRVFKKMVGISPQAFQRLLSDV